MFGFLKKKLKDGIDKISKVVSEKEEEKIEEAVEEVRKEEKIEEPKEQLVKEVEEELESKEEEAPKEEKIEGVEITYFVHGTTTDNEKGISTGWAQGELSYIGKKQSVELKEKIEGKKFDAVFCSDLARAVESAELVFADRFEVRKDDRLREINYGDYNQKEESYVSPIKRNHIEKPFPSGESYMDVQRRVAKFLNYLVDNFYGKRIAIVSHQAPQLALDVILNGKSWEQAFDEDWRNTKNWQPGWGYKIREKVEVPKEFVAEAVERETKEMIEDTEEIIEEVKKIEAPKEQKAEEKPEEKKEEAKEEPKELVKEKPKKSIIDKIFKREAKEPEKPKVEEKPKEPEKPKEEPKEPVKEKTKEKPIETVKAEIKKEEKGIIAKIRRKVTEKKIEEEDVKDILREIETSLISSDVAVEVSEKIVNDLKGNLVGKFIKKGQVENVVRDSIKNSINEILDVETFDMIEKAKTKKPFLIVFLGFNGVGKTTSIARIGYMLKNKGMSCVFAAADSWRAAAIEQLEEHGRRLGIDVIKHKYGADPAAVIFDAVKHAESKMIDVVLADTAGRSHANTNLMEELKKIIKVNKPDLKLLVLDALTGNDIYDQCKLFNDAVGVDGMILTKADVYEKGGAALAASHTINKPILYMGVGQEYGDLVKFDPKDIAEKLLD